MRVPLLFLFFFFNDTATTEIYTLSLHDALPISSPRSGPRPSQPGYSAQRATTWAASWVTVTAQVVDRKSTRLNSSHLGISYAVFCLKKKKLTSPRLDNHDASARPPVVARSRPPA